MRSHLSSIIGSLTHNEIFRTGIKLLGIVTPSRLKDLPMEVNNIRTPGTLVEVIDILGDDGYLKDVLELS
jgi:hypothetical protein